MDYVLLVSVIVVVTFLAVVEVRSRRAKRAEQPAALAETEIEHLADHDVDRRTRTN